uniref:NADH-ubiquinone oxidoreductase chain 2 n=1 Tax=Bryopa lata TaxID=1969317 RepID=A0A1U9XPD0_9BIVA|nr:NADH dehydrogenase subunit 2 [Bryopa lata]AQZ26109.1 NADH dehydrogenase subunit 2 [Bryopa lata]
MVKGRRWGKSVYFTPAQLAFLLMSVFGVLVCLSSANWLGVWFGLEVNLFGFVPYMSGSRRVGEMESTVKYFLSQEAGSGVLMLGIVGMVVSSGSSLVGMPLGSGYFWGPALVGLLTKLGVAPFHFWVAGSMAEVSWGACFLLNTLQKIGPLFSVAYLVNSCWVALVWLGGISVVVGGIGGSFQSRLRPLLGYSSVGHMGWCLACVANSVSDVLFYFFWYSVVLAGVFGLLGEMGVYGMETVMNYMGGGSWFILSVSLLSLGGFPPFVIFFAKVRAMLCIWGSVPLAIGLYLVGSVIGFYYYFNLVFTFTIAGMSSCNVLNWSDRFKFSALFMIILLPLGGSLSIW